MGGRSEFQTLIDAMLTEVLEPHLMEAVGPEVRELLATVREFPKPIHDWCVEQGIDYTFHVEYRDGLICWYDMADHHRVYLMLRWY